MTSNVDAIISRGKERTMGLNSKYEGLSMNNFRPDVSGAMGRRRLQGRGTYTTLFVLSCYHPISLFSFIVFQKKTLNFNLPSLSKRERKSNHSAGLKLFRRYVACRAVGGKLIGRETKVVYGCLPCPHRQGGTSPSMQDGVSEYYTRTE